LPVPVGMPVRRCCVGRAVDIGTLKAGEGRIEMIAVTVLSVIGGFLTLIGAWFWIGAYAILVAPLAAGGIAIVIGAYLAFQRSRSSSGRRNRSAMTRTEVHLG
jgi:hypothetical protein